MVYAANLFSVQFLLHGGYGRIDLATAAMGARRSKSATMANAKAALPLRHLDHFGHSCPTCSRSSLSVVESHLLRVLSELPPHLQLDILLVAPFRCQRRLRRGRGQPAPCVMREMRLLAVSSQPHLKFWVPALLLPTRSAPREFGQGVVL